MPCSEAGITCFIDLLKNELPEHRDNRGKRHSLALVIVAFVLATLVGRQKLSSIHRFMCNRSDWLHELTKTPKVKPISRAHLPRFLDGLHWMDAGERQSVVLAVNHDTREAIAQAQQYGDKSSEIPVVRQLLAVAALSAKPVAMSVSGKLEPKILCASTNWQVTVGESPIQERSSEPS